MPTLHILIIYPIWYKESAELSLAFDLFKNNFPKAYRINFIILETNKNADEFPDDIKLNDAIESALNDILRLQAADSDVIFFVKEPAILMHEAVIHRMVRLINNEEIDCVIPSSYPDEYPTAPEQHYFTLKGYESYVSTYLKEKEAGFIAYDNRAVFMFAIKPSLISKIIKQPGYFQIPAQSGHKTVISLGAYIHPFFDYFSGANEEMIELIPLMAKSLLDIGCSNGEFAYAVKKQRSIFVAGIEVNATAAKIAQAKIDKVYMSDALTLTTDQQFDCVTCLDVLEHFSEPDTLLKHIASTFLNDHGTLLLSIPNIGHWSIVNDLLSGRWDYLPGGTLCTTHVRFFTRKTITDLLKRSGFEVEKIIPVQAELPQKTHDNLLSLEKQGQHIDWESLKTVSFRVIARKSIRNG